jgi:hypothetical protein
LGERVTPDPPPPEVTPVPLRPTDCGLPLALSVTATAAVLVPEAVGLKVTLIVQLPGAATLEPQLLVWAKSPLLAPVRAMPAMVSVALPVFESVTVCAGLIVPTV